MKNVQYSIFVEGMFSEMVKSNIADYLNRKATLIGFTGASNKDWKSFITVDYDTIENVFIAAEISYRVEPLDDMVNSCSTNSIVIGEMIDFII